MNRHIVTGAGPIGSGLARSLADLGHHVQVVTRTGTAPSHANIEPIKLDVANAATELTKLAAGAATITNALNPPYDKWPELWPSLHRSLLAAAQSSGATLVSMENLYGYGRPAHPGGVIKDGDPLRPISNKGAVRAKMSEEIFALAASGTLRATAVRASDFFGPEVTDAAIGERSVAQMFGGKKVQVVGRTNLAHTISYVPDVVRALTICATDERAVGRPWHAPATPALTVAEIWAALAKAADLPNPKLSGLTGLPRRLAGLLLPILRQIEEISYQFDEPWVMDSSDFTNTFGLVATPFPEAAAATMAWWKHRLNPTTVSG